MSLPSSPRVPISPDVSRRRHPRPREKRKALRDFYGLQQSNEPAEDNPELDAQDFDAMAHLKEISASRDIKGLLRLENTLIREIRVFAGERKGLMYDNYGRMITATDTIKHMRQELEPTIPTRDTFDEVLKSIHNLTVDPTNSTLVESSTKLVTKEDNPDVMLKKWIQGGPDRIERLIKSGRLDVARLELADVEKEATLLNDGERQALNKALGWASSTLDEEGGYADAAEAQDAVRTASQ